MNHLIKIYLLFFTLFFACQSYGQNKFNLDSVYSTVPDSLKDDKKFDYLLSLALKIKATDIKLSKALVEDVVSKTHVEGYEMQYARALGSLAQIYGLEGKDDLLLKTYLEAVQVYEGILDNAAYAIHKEKIIDNIAVCYNNLAQVYVNKEEYDLALDFYLNSLKQTIKVNDSLGISIRCYNIGFVYMNLDRYDSAFYYMNWSKQLETSMNSAEGLAYAHEGLASIYDRKKEYLKALIHVDSALSFIDHYGDDLFKMEILFMKSQILYNIGGVQEASVVLNLAYEMAKAVGYKSLQLDALNKLKDFYFELKDYKKAFLTARFQIELMKEIAEEETERKVEEFMIQYKTEQKDLEIEQLAFQNKLKEEANLNLIQRQKAEDSRRTIINWSFGAGFVLLCLIGFLLYVDSRRRKRINRFLKTNNESLARKNEQILHQSKLIGDSINYAQNIQRAILPTSKEMNDCFPEHFVLFQPKDVVSGDFYWLYQIPNSKKVLFSVADCTGHGVPGAFMSIVGHALLEKIAKQLQIHKPNEMLNQLAIELQNTLKRGEDSRVDDGMDIALILVDYENYNIHFSGARNPILISSNKELNQLKGDRIDLGKQVNVSFHEEIISFQKGDQLYLFTDGYVDQKGGTEGKKYFIKRFRDFIESIQHESVNDQKKLLYQEFTEWKGDNEQLDDTLLVGIKL